MPELKEFYYDLSNYNDNTLTTEWINIQNSVNILFSVKSNQNCDIYADFSKNADHIVESTITKSLLANNSTELIVCCLSRYVRFRIENYALPVNLLTQGFYFEASILQNITSNTVNQVVDVSNTSFDISNFPTNFDVEVTNFPTGFDANITNNNLNTTVTNFPSSTTISNFPSEISVNNIPRSSFNTPLISTLNPFPGMQYSFNYLGQVNNPVFLNQTQLGYTPYLYTFGSTNSTNSSYSSQNNLISLCGMSGDIGDFESVIGDNVLPYRPGQSMIIRFTAIFSVATLTNEYDMKIGLGLKSDKTAKPITSGCFVGWDETDQLYVSYINNGSETKALQSNFNVDKLNGISSTFTINAQKINIYQIKYAYLGVANIEFQVYDASKSAFITMHVFQNANNIETTHLSNPSGSFLMQVEKKTTNNHLASYNWKLGCASYACFLTDTISFNIGFSYSNTVALNGTNETRIIILSNKTNWVTSRYSPLPILIQNMGISSFPNSGSASNGVVTFKIYRKPSYSVDPTYSFIAQYKTPISSGTGETVTSFGTLFNQWSNTNGTSQNLFFDAKQFILAPDTDYIFTAQSTVANYTASISVNWIEFS